MGVPDLKCHTHCLESIGKNLIESAAIFETGVAGVLAAESELLEALIEREECTSILLKVNKEINLIVCCLEELEENIVKKIEIGKSIGNF